MYFCLLYQTEFRAKMCCFLWAFCRRSCSEWCMAGINNRSRKILTDSRHHIASFPPCLHVLMCEIWCTIIGFTCSKKRPEVYSTGDLSSQDFVFLHCLQLLMLQFNLQAPHLCQVPVYMHVHTLYVMCVWMWCMYVYMHACVCVTVIPDSVWHPSIWPCCCLSERSSVFVSASGVGALCVWVELGAGWKIIGGHCFASPLLTHVGQGPELRINQSMYTGLWGHFSAFKQALLMRWFATSLALRRAYLSFRFDI